MEFLDYMAKKSLKDFFIWAQLFEGRLALIQG